MLRILLLRTAGTNCDRELAYAFKLAGGENVCVDALHVNTLLASPAAFEHYQILAIPGGFSYGDDIASGKILANQLIHHLQKNLRQFIDDGKLVLGICNGFQVLVKSGLLPGPVPQLDSADWHPTTLTYNTSGKFEDRWVRVKPASKLCKWIPENCPVLDLPVAHGEGRFVTRTPEILTALKNNDQVAFQYVDSIGNQAASFPDNPNGSTDAIAGICDITGRVLGLMPHPERIADPLNHPLFTRGHKAADGLPLFQTAFAYLHANQTATV
ncbi:MAG: phosphoribosylformylglycinamidine synthase I [Phycisphaerales bacterium]|nr:phosphoribosylformylglycinamidine synthase I [Phycisphaerales bacterium]